MTTHYLLTDGGTNGRKLKALCGAYVLSVTHSVEPTCPTCAAWLPDELKREDDQIDAMGFEVVDGLLLEKGR